MTRTLRSIFSIVIAVAMICSVFPMSVLAADDNAPPLGQSGTITGFDYIEPIEVEHSTAEAAIPFPDTVKATVQLDGDETATPATTGGEISVDIAVGAWQIAFGEYDPDTADRYVFEAVRESMTLPDGVILPDDAELPCVAVDVGEVEIGIMPVAAASTTAKISFVTGTSQELTGSGGGTANWDGSGTLTLTDFVHSSEAQVMIGLPNNSKIVFSGTNQITQTGTATGGNIDMIEVTGSLEIESSGNDASLTLLGKGETNTGSSNGAYRAISTTNDGDMKITLNNDAAFTVDLYEIEQDIQNTQQYNIALRLDGTGDLTIAGDGTGIVTLRTRNLEIAADSKLCDPVQANSLTIYNTDVKALGGDVTTDTYALTFDTANKRFAYANSTDGSRISFIKIWKPMYTVTYNANAGAESITVPATAKYAPNSTVTVNFTIGTRDGYDFEGWATTAGAATPTYTEAGTSNFSITGNTTLYAIWSSDTALTATGILTFNGSTFTSNGSQGNLTDFKADSLAELNGRAKTWYIDGSTLYLYNFVYSTTSTYALRTNGTGAKTIVLKGDNSFTSSYSSDSLTAGLYIDAGALTISGNGTMTLQAGTSILDDAYSDGRSAGIYKNSTGALTISDRAKVTAKGGTAAKGSYGIYADVSGTVTVGQSTLIAQAGAGTTESGALRLSAALSSTPNTPMGYASDGDELKALSYDNSSKLYKVTEGSAIAIYAEIVSENTDTVINIAAIQGVTAPVALATPVTTITETDQYTGTVTWSPTVNGTFAYDTTYTATITLTPKTDYTLTDVGANFFTVAGATANNSADSGVITAEFPATGSAPAADTAINIAAIAGVTAPVAGATPVTTITETMQYTGTVTWSPTVSGTFDYEQAYTATITLTPKTGYTLTGVGANFFTVADATTVSNSAGNGVITAVFPATGSESYKWDFTQNTSTAGNINTDGYTWDGTDASTANMQMKNLTINITDKDFGMKFPDKAIVIELLDGSTNSITVNNNGTDVRGLTGGKNITVKGSGTLNITVTGNGSTNVYGIITDSTASKNSIDSVTVNVTAIGGSTVNIAYAGGSDSTYIPLSIDNGGVLNADGSNAANGIGIDNGNKNVSIANGTGSITAKGSSQAIKANMIMADTNYEFSAIASTAYDGSNPTTTKFTGMWSGNSASVKNVSLTTDTGGGGGGGTAPTITTASLPNGTVGTAYSQTLAATGDATITWSIDSGSLPANLTISGNTISGTPTTAGTSNFTIKATNSAGSATKSLSITVDAVAVTVTSVTIETAPTKTTYTAGETLDLTGLVVTLNKSNSTTEDVAFADFASKNITVSPTNGTTLTTSNTSVTITYTPDNKSVNQAITVNPAAVTVASVTIKTAPTKTTYTAGETLDLSGLVVTLNKSNSTTEDVAFADFASKNITVNPANGTMLTTSNTSVTITYTPDNKSVNQAITVNAQTYAISLSANPTAGGSVSGGGTFTGGTSQTVTATANNTYQFLNWTESSNVVSTNASYTFTLTANRTLVANFVLSGNTNVEADPVGNAPAPALPNPDAVLGAVLDDTDITAINGGATITVSLEVKEETPDQTDQTAVENEIAADQDVGMYLDISMFKEISTGGGRQSVTTLNAPIQIEFDVPAALKAPSGKTRTFSVVRVHSGSADTLSNESSNPNKIRFSTDKFSTYALVYKETSTPAPTPDRDSDSSSGGSSKPDSSPAPNPWLEPNPAQTLATSANKAQQDSIRTKSTDTYGVRKASWPKMNGYRYYHDTMEGNAVQVRLYVDNPTAMKRDILVTGFVKGSIVDSRKAFLEKWFTNQIRVIHMDESEPWGQNVRIAAKVDLANMDTKKLYFYSYDKKANKYTRITDPKYWIDKNGYLHFYTTYAGDIIISENPLEKR